jgi:hypothetical protein
MVDGVAAATAAIIYSQANNLKNRLKDFIELKHLAWYLYIMQECHRSIMERYNAPGVSLLLVEAQSWNTMHFCLRSSSINDTSNLSRCPL